MKQWKRFICWILMLVLIGTFAANDATVLAAGTNQTIAVEAGLGYYTILPNKLLLTSAATLDGQPAGDTVTYTWEQVSGPEAVVFEKEHQAVTYATATQAGKYEFRVTVSNGVKSASDTTFVNVYDEEGRYGNPLLPGMFPDPHILYDNGKFYIYATSMENDAGAYGRASVWVSEDFVNWDMQLTNFPVYGEFGGDIWAPDIIKIGEKYYQTITRSGYYDTVIAVADSPVGPWKNVRADGKSIVGSNPHAADTVVSAYNMDSHPFVDDDGTIYLYWGWSDSMVAKLTDDMTAIDGEVTFLKGTRWVADGGSHPQSLTVDLGRAYKLDEIRTSPEYRNIIYKYKIEYSNDKINWKLYADRSTNGVVCGNTHYTDVGSGSGRYVRITILDSQGHWASLYDFSIYSNGQKVSQGKPVTASSTWNDGTKPENAVDSSNGPCLSDYVEAPYVIKRNGVYYLLYSSGALHDGTYSVHYAMSESPYGPFITPENNVILKSNGEETTKGPGHNSVLLFEGEYYIVYHQHNQPHVDGAGVFRQTAVDKLEFNEDGTIKPVVPTQTGIGALLPYQEQGEDLALGKYAWATSQTDANCIAEYALDHNNASKWKAANNTYPQSLTVDLEEVHKICRIETSFEYPTLSYKYKLETSVDGENWETYVDRTSRFTTAVSPRKDSKDAQARYVRITITGCERPENNAGIYSLSVFKAPHEHAYNQEVTLPTCTQGGFTTHTCECGETYTDGQTAALDHDWSQWTVTKTASYTEKGVESRNCTRCDQTQSRDIPVLEPGECYFKNFTDCKHQWYHEAVDFAVHKGLMQGVADKSFAPAGKMTRAMVVTVLYRMAGSPEVTQSATFTDVPSGQWYSDAIAWAQTNAVVQGVGQDLFAPNDYVTREQIATILWRYAGEREVQADLAGFRDADQISDYAHKAMHWAVAEGIFNGDANANLCPRDHATRGEFSCIVMRYSDGVYVCNE